MADFDPALERYFKRNWPAFRKRYNAFLLSSALSLLGAVGVLHTAWGFWTGSLKAVGPIDMLGLILTIIGVLMTALSYRQRHDLYRELLPPPGQVFYAVCHPPKSHQDERDHPDDLKVERDRILALRPGHEEASKGFTHMISALCPEEVAIRSRDLDTALIRAASIPFVISEERTFQSALTKAQLQLLVSKVHGPSVTHDDAKLCLVSDFHDLEMPVILASRSYFDSLVTNEAFRSVLYQRPRQASRAGELVSRFPELKQALEYRGDTVLPALGSTPAANHIGASVFVLSSDGFPVLFEQGSEQEEGAGHLVVSGTGSADWEDRLPLNGGVDFLRFVRRTMAREFAEESTLSDADGLYSREIRRAGRRAAFDRLSDEVLVTGYFRWAGRFGKPEFVGVMRSDVTLANLIAHEDEVVKLRDGLGLRTQIARLSDLLILRDKLESAKSRRGLGITLSSAMTFTRMFEIATDGTDDEREAFCAALKIENA